MKRLTLLCGALALLASAEACARDRPANEAADSAAAVRAVDSLRADSVRQADTVKPTASIAVGAIRVLAVGLAPRALEAQSVASSTSSNAVAHRPHSKLWWATWAVVAVLLIGAIVAFLKRHKGYDPAAVQGDDGL